MSYSQRNEEEHILAACAHAKRRRLLDIGAWHATDKSNSRALIEQGWDAVLIEPSPGPLRGLVAEYSNSAYDVQIVGAAIGCEPGLFEMMITDDAVSTSDHTRGEEWARHTEFIGTLIVPTLTLFDILNRFGDFDFVSIDTEGSSIDLLHVLLATEMMPACICVEHDNRIVEAMQAARARHYRPVYESTENIVFALGDE